MRVGSPMLAILNNHFLDYPTPMNLNYFWSFGSLAGMSLIMQMVTGLFLSMHYTPHTALAFLSVEHIMRDVNYGWLFRYTHSNGASMFFMTVYMHMARGLFYTSYAKPRQWVWFTGVLLFMLMMVTAFTGYVLPWGQMSYWGATVMTNLFSSMPLMGEPITTWLWGGYSMDNATLQSFYTLHFLLPFVLLGLTALHIALLHVHGSSNPLGVGDYDVITFYPYFFYKDLFGFFMYLFVLAMLVFYYPNWLGHPDNYMPANPLVTPAHIVPEWYFLIFYAMLRAVPTKLGGVILMGWSMMVLFFLPYLYNPMILGPRFKPLFTMMFWLFVNNVFWLGYLGGLPATGMNVTMIQFCTVFYFSYFLLMLPGCNIIESDFYDEMNDY